jgi:thiamine-phosphate pyrophosphorylase
MQIEGNPDRTTILRIIDANVNRCAEGARVIEEIARFALDDEDLMRELKDLRHEIRALPAMFSGETVPYRDSAGDVGGKFSTPSEERRETLAGTARANFFRVEEGLRVIEEFGKLLSASGARKAKSLRFMVYGIEKGLIAAGPEGASFPASPFLYTFIDRSLVEAADVEAVAADLREGRSDMIQYRAKDLALGEMRSDITRVLPLTREAGVPLIVNDHPELAAETGADGVHLGAGDADPAGAREMLGPFRIIGISVRTASDVTNAPLDLLNYVAAGAMFSTKTKKDAVVTGLENLSIIRAATGLPLVAIGGISPMNASSVLDAGADGLAVISAVLSGEIVKNCFTFREIIDRTR